MNRLTAVAAIAALTLTSALSHAQTAYPAAPPPPPPPPPPGAAVAPAPEWIAPPPPPLPTVQRRARGARASGHPAAEHSDTGLAIGQTFAALGMNVAAGLAVAALGGMVIVAGSMNDGMYGNTSRDIMIGAAVLAPPVMAIASSGIAYQLSKKCPRDHSWGYTFLVGVGGAAATSFMVSAYALGAFNPNPWGGGNTSRDGVIASALIGSALTAGLEVLTLNLTGPAAVAPTPLVLRGGGGLALTGTF